MPRRPWPALLAAATVVGLLVLSTSACAQSPVSAAPPVPAGWIKGFVFTAWSPDGYASDAAQRSLDAMTTTGPNAVALIATLYQDAPDSSEVGPDPERTPSAGSLATAIERARARGLRVRLRVPVDLRSGGLRSSIDPADPHAWFASYGRWLVHYARLAEAEGVDSLDVGVELAGLSGAAHERRWRCLIARVRRVFHGRLSYGANWDEYRQVGWWDALDEIGVDAYFPLAREPGAGVDAVVAAWAPYLDELEAVQARFRRPVVFSELGYTSTPLALVQPWAPGDTYDPAEQQTGFAAAFRALAGKSWFGGVYIWHWSDDPTAGGPGDLDHTPQGKPAEATIREWFGASPSTGQEAGR
jgi:hypothetical protein